ncbi:probable G-protein coupled receptor 139 [Amblyraja radiata]|uniref:probable G-protein coupled receptor 139 n=1 Tax=Amblyraja radiata TaxID=386614 RepID=UPI001402B47E|nr:probable G-protein coupled receptor 139 [Amblyraja radiata]
MWQHIDLVSFFLGLQSPLESRGGERLLSVIESGEPGVNSVAIVILTRRKCGLSRCITRYLLAMATSDLMVVIIAVAVEQINNMFLLIKVLFITPVCSFTLVLRFAALDCSVWFTVAFTFDRFVAICCQKLRVKYCTERTAIIIVAIITFVGCARSVPFFFAVNPHVVIDEVPWYCIPKPEYFTSPVWRIRELIDSIMTPLLPICLILLFNALTVRHIIAANRLRKGLRSSVESQKDPEVENRRKSMILLFAISANFILLWLTYVVHSFKWQVQNVYYRDKYLNSPVYNIQQFGFMLQFLSSCTNTCIYGFTQKKFREELKNGVKFLVTFDGRLCKLKNIFFMTQLNERKA